MTLNSIGVEKRGALLDVGSLISGGRAADTAVNGGIGRGRARKEVRRRRGGGGASIYEGGEERAGSHCGGGGGGCGGDRPMMEELVLVIQTFRNRISHVAHALGTHRV